MTRELPAAWRRLLERDRSGRAWLLARLALLAGVLILLWGMVRYFLAFIRTSQAGGLIGLLFVSFGVGIALALWMNRSTDPKYPRELLQLMDRARTGDAASQRQLALRYLSGAPGIHKSSSEAIHWLVKAAQGGDAEAAYVLSGLMKAGDGMLADEVEARRWLSRAVEAGHGPAAERLARWNSGEPEPPPPRAPQAPIPEPEAPPSRLEAFLEGLPPWLRKTPLALLVLVSLLGVVAYLLAVFTALLLFAYSVSPLATLLMGGLFLGALAFTGSALFLHRNQDARYAGSSMRLVRRAEAGDPKAQLLLAQAYLEGSRGLTKDPAQASWWLQRCAEGGDPKSAYLLAQWIEQGLGHHRNLPLARSWMQRAAQGGYGPAKHLVEKWRQAEEAAKTSSPEGD